MIIFQDALLRDHLFSDIHPEEKNAQCMRIFCFVTMFRRMRKWVIDAILTIHIAKKQAFFEPMDCTKKNLDQLVQKPFCVTYICAYVCVSLDWVKVMWL